MIIIIVIIIIIIIVIIIIIILVFLSQTLQSMLASVRKGGKINEAEIPRPVASGNRDGAVPPSAPPTSALSPPEHHEELDSAVETSPVSPETISVPMLPVRMSTNLKYSRKGLNR